VNTHAVSQLADSPEHPAMRKPRGDMGPAEPEKTLTFVFHLLEERLKQ
jgi:hypothetical protein